MVILGLQFGHDGSACVIRDGRLASYVYREREIRVKHAIGLTTRELELALSRAGITESDIDAVAITSTQNVEILSGLIEGFGIRFQPHPAHAAPSPLRDLFAQMGVRVEDKLSFQLRDLFSGGQADGLQRKIYSAMLPEKDLLGHNAIESTGWLDTYISVEPWASGRSLADIARTDASDLFGTDAVKLGFHYPVTVALRGRSLPGYFVFHHMAHAAACYYRSGFDEAAIVTHDGFGDGAGNQSGMIFYGRGPEIFPLHPHHMAIGALYEAVGIHLQLGYVGAPGKLMGLAPYGKPRFFRHEMVGNWHEILARFGSPHANAWMKHCKEMARLMKYDMSSIGDRTRMIEPINADIAASTQKLFEECYLQAIYSAHGMLLASGVKTSRLCLTGGTALNCPSNSRIHREAPFDEIFIEPSCGDDGLAIGAALYAHHQLHAQPLRPVDGPHLSPYIGPVVPEGEIAAALARNAERVRFERVDDATRRAAREVFEDKVIAWFEGGSESGPRALGHRSIVANPMHGANWKRVNVIKGREWWRPFAPSVTEEEAQRWFSGLPHPSPYMLFTGQVLSDRLPAIRHVDGSSRIQTVDPSVGAYYDLVKEFGLLSGVAVVLNTSFNGPGEPIIETPEQAIAFLLGTDLDALYMGNYRAVKAQGS